MRAVLATVCALALAGCMEHAEDTAVPTEQHIVRLEAALSKLPCVGNLDLWERNYRFSRKPGLLSAHSLNPDLDIIEFHLRRAGTVTIKPDRRVMHWGQSKDWPDSNAVRAIDGRYKIDGGRLSVSRCVPVRDG